VKASVVEVAKTAWASGHARCAEQRVCRNRGNGLKTVPYNYYNYNFYLDL